MLNRKYFLRKTKNRRIFASSINDKQTFIIIHFKTWRLGYIQPPQHYDD